MARAGSLLLIAKIAMFAVLAPLTLPVTAGERLHWQASREPALVDSFLQNWQQQRGRLPVLLDRADDTVLTVTDRLTPAAGSPRQLVLALARTAGAAAPGQAGIYAEANADALLALWQRLLPDRQPAGLLVGAASRAQWPHWRQRAQQQHVLLKPGFVRPGEQAQRVYGLLRPSIAVLLYSTELATADPVAVSVILRESLSSGLPVLGTERSLLPAGALAVLQQTDAARGKQAAILALALLRGEQPGWQEPAELELTLNYQVARTLNLPLGRDAVSNQPPVGNENSQNNESSKASSLQQNDKRD